MQFQTLENIKLEKIAAAFNLAFSDYFVPINLTADQLAAKLKTESVDLALSAGAFEGEELIGFIFHGIDTINGQMTAYNAGTGAIPDHRGKKITKQLYGFILPKLKEAGIKKIQLEVIAENEPAKAVYRDVGFTLKRALLCLKGSIQVPAPERNWIVQPLETYNWPVLKSFWDWQPSWQNSSRVMDSLTGTNIALGLFDKNTLAGYLIYNPVLKRAPHFAIAKPYRKQGAATALFHYVANHFSPEIALINVDGESKATLDFLQHIGLSTYITQYELEYVVASG